MWCRMWCQCFITPHTLTGRKADTTIISGYTGVIDDLLKKGVSNSEVILERIQEQGFQGSLTTVKRYIQSHKYLIPPKRQTVAPQGNRGRRYSSDAGESYQMDWGFVNVDTGNGTSYKVACFAMICHHCGERYIEFFPNTCRVQREDFTLYIYDLELRKVLITHDVTWSRKDSFCKGQFTDDQPEEKLMEYPSKALGLLPQNPAQDATS